MTSGDDSKLSKACEKAVGETTIANAAIIQGSAPEEAFACEVKDGPDDAVGEFIELHEKNRSRGRIDARVLAQIVDQKSPSLNYRTSQTTRLLIPIARDLTPTQALPSERPDLGASDPDERKRRERLAKSGEHVGKMFEQAAQIQKITKTPAGLSTDIGHKLITAGASLAPALVTMIILSFMKRTFKK